MSTTTAAIDYVEAPTTEPIAEVIFAADIGNARANMIVQAGDSHPVQIDMPTARSLDIVFARDVFSRRGLAPDAWRQLKSDDHILTVDGIDTFVGQLAVEHARASSSGRGSDARYSDGTTREFMLAGIPAALPKASKFAVRCATLLPIKLWEAHHHAVENSLRRRYDYRYNGKPIEASFDQVVVYREGEAAYHALDKKPQGRAIMLDAGGRTVNVALFNNGQYRDGITIDNMGVEVVFDALDRALELDNLRRLEPSERLQLQTAIAAGLPFHISHHQTAHRIDTRARQLFDATARRLVQEVQRHVAIEAAEDGAFVGGGGIEPFFGRVVADLLPVVQLVDQPQNKNVAGAIVQLAGQPVKKARSAKR